MYLITNRKLCDEKRYIEIIRESILNGVENIIIREKDLSNDKLEMLYIKIKENLIDIKTKYKSKIHNVNLIINSNIEVFEKVDADGIHLPLNLFRELVDNKFEFNENKILGLSLHSIDDILYIKEITNKKNIKVDYITLSHIYETKCKEGLKPNGVELLKKSRKITDLKIVALGGILPKNVDEVIKYCDDFAVMSTIMTCSEVRSTINDYLSKYKYIK